MMEGQNKPSRPWTRIFGIIIPYFLIAGTFQYVGMRIAGLDFNHLPVKTTSAQDFITCFFALAGTVLTVWLFRKHVDKQPFVSLGFGIKTIKKDILLGLLIGFTIMSISFFILLLMHQIKFISIKFNISDIFYSLGFYVFVAITEELLVRGYMLNNLLASFNKYVALIISSVIFSLLHAANPNITAFALFELALSGILLGLAYIYTKNLWFSIALHLSWNFFQGTIFGFNVSGMEKYKLIITSTPANSIWNGGLFGYEGSVTSVFFQLLAIGVVYFIYNKQAPCFINSNKIP